MKRVLACVLVFSVLLSAGGVARAAEMPSGPAAAGDETAGEDPAADGLAPKENTEENTEDAPGPVQDAAPGENVADGTAPAEHAADGVPQENTPGADTPDEDAPDADTTDADAAADMPPADGVTALAAPNYTDGRKFLNQWSFLDANNNRMELTATYACQLSGQSTADIIQKIKDTILPKKLRGWSAVDDSANKVFDLYGFVFDLEDNEERYEMTASGPNSIPAYNNPGSYAWGTMPIPSDFWKTVENYTALTDRQELVFYVDIPIKKNSADKECRIYVNSNEQEDHKNSWGNTYFNPQLVRFTVTLRDINLSAYTVPAASPSNVTVNLFDYWVQGYGEKPTASKTIQNPNGGDILPKSDSHYHEDGSEGALSATPTVYSTQNDWNTGINQGHLLLFGDGMIHAGLWNKGAGENCRYGKAYAGTEGIVKNVLSADGYPELDLSMAKGILGAKEGEAPEESAIPGLKKYQLIKDYALTGDHDTGAPDNGYKSKDIQNLSNTVINSWGKNIANDAESLAYLFDPKVVHPNKKSYRNVTGLFQLDGQGYYYYNMRENFAEFKEEKTAGSDGRFLLYDAPATTRSDSTDTSIGNFFPFNRGEEVFNALQTVNGAETLASVGVGCSGNTMNHHLGMTVQVDFLQPANGKIGTGSGAEPMSFAFSGDDDVWVFIDGALVLDLGGIHSEIYGTIDFATGEVCIGRAFYTKGIPENPADPANLVTRTTLRALYAAAGKAGETQWTGDTFASGTSHTLKMFYLERGNYDSSIALRFNLQPLLHQQIRKVDQNGSALKDVEFDLYGAAVCGATEAGAIRCLYTDSDTDVDNQTFYVRQEGNTSLCHLRTDTDGIALFRQTDGSFFNFADRGDQYYVLQETSAPAGYRSQPVGIVLHYNAATAELSVANRWTTGAYACSVANIAAGGALTDVPEDDQRDGLAVAVPLLERKGVSGANYLALYGSNLTKFDAEAPFSLGDAEAVRTAALTAALHQAADSAGSPWHLEWDAGNRRLYGTLSDLPGLATRYKLNNPARGDLHMVYGVLSEAALGKLGVAGSTHAARYENLRKKLTSPGAVAAALGKLTDPEDFQLISDESMRRINRSFRSMVYIPNERRELRVRKIGADGEPLAGAAFALFDKDKNQVAAGKTDADGSLVFSPTAAGADGQAAMTWGAAGTRYTLKETAAPAGYTRNPTEVPVVVGSYSIYADAGTANDGVRVMAGAGRLTQTMRQCAEVNQVDVTLRDITVFMQTQQSGAFTQDGWRDAPLENTAVPRRMNLHFGRNAEVDYGLHDEDGGKIFKPWFVTDEGFVRARVQQNLDALTGQAYDGVQNGVHFDRLGDTDLTNLFSLLNIVVFTDEETNAPDEPAGQLTVRKTVAGTPGEADALRLFRFRLELAGDGINPDDTFAYRFYGDDKAGQIQNGGELLLHHDEAVTILGLPAGTRYTVTELDRHGYELLITDGAGQQADGTGTVPAGGTAAVTFTNTKTRPDTPDPTDPDDPDDPPKDPDTPPTDPDTPPTDPDTPPTDPDTPPTDPDTPPTNPDTPPTDPDTPPTDPDTPPTDPVTPPTDPDTPPTDPVTPQSGKGRVPKTGDAGAGVFWLLTGAASAFGIASLCADRPADRRRRRARR